MLRELACKPGSVIEGVICLAAQLPVPSLPPVGILFAAGHHRVIAHTFPVGVAADRVCRAAQFPARR